MDETLSHDWISAYADGELSPAEVVRVEEKLRNSPEAMRELFEIRALSGLIGEAVEVNVPPDFSAQVMSQAERESLIGKSPIDHSEPHRRTRKLLPILTVCSSLACLAFVLFLVRPGMSPIAPASTSESSVASNEAKTSSVVDSSAVNDHEVALVESELELPEMSEALKPETISLEADLLRLAMDVDGVTKESILKVISPINLKEDTEIGDVIRALSMSAGEVAIVELTVVDRQQGIDNLQFILSGSSIKNEVSVPLDDLKPRDEELFTVFVEAAPSQLHSVLEKMQQDMEFATVQVSTTIPADDLEPYFVSNGYASVELNRENIAYRESLDERKELEKLPVLASDARSSATSESKPDPIVAKNPLPTREAKDAKQDLAKPETAAKSQWNDSAQFARSRQTIVRLPQQATFDLIDQNKPVHDPEPAAEMRRTIVTNNLKKLNQPIPAASETKLQEKLEDLFDLPVSELRQVQVLFVLRSDPSEAPLPAPKPAPR